MMKPITISPRRVCLPACAAALCCLPAFAAGCAHSGPERAWDHALAARLLQPPAAAPVAPAEPPTTAASPIRNLQFAICNLQLPSRRSPFRLAAFADAPPADGADPGAPAVDHSTADKSKYHLFNRTPRELMREMSTDRPDKTESPFTVDAGHFQIEMDIVSYTFDRRQPGGNGTDDHGFAFAPMNLKAGLLNGVDVQFILEPFNYERSRERDTGARENRYGFGDLTTRLKINLWGNDGGEGFFGQTAFGVMPFLKVPTNVGTVSSGGTTTRRTAIAERTVEAGVIFPFAADLPGGFSLGAMAEFDFLRNRSNSRYHTEFIQTITLGHDIVGDLAGYVELFSSIGTEKGERRWVATLDLGLTYAVTENIQLDAGINIGLTRAADDFNPFAGLSLRF